MPVLFNNIIADDVCLSLKKQPLPIFDSVLISLLLGVSLFITSSVAYASGSEFPTLLLPEESQSKFF